MAKQGETKGAAMKMRKRKQVLYKKMWAADAFARGVWKVMYVLREANYKMSRAMYEAYLAARGQG